MIRVAMAVLLATGLVGTSLAALDVARRDFSDSQLRAEADRLVTAVRDLAARDGAVRPGSPGPRRVVTLDLPGRSWTEAGVDFVSIGGDGPVIDDENGSAPILAWRVDGGVTIERRLSGLGVTVEHVDDGRDGPLVLTSPGSHRLALTLVERRGERLVTVRRLD